LPEKLLTQREICIKFISLFEKIGKGEKELEYKHVYGPVHSRRLGVSLGISTVPRKVCSFDCVYCEVAKTTLLTTKRAEYVPAEEILVEVENFLENYSGEPLEHITFSGFGEPTLNSKIGYMIKEIKKMTDVPVVVLSNGSLVLRKDVQNDLLSADIVKLTLNATHEKAFKRINQQEKSIQPDEVIKGLIEFRKIFKGELWIEILLVKGINDNAENYIGLHRALRRIKANKVHINTVVRKPSFGFASPLTYEELLRAQAIIGNDAEIIGKVSKPVTTEEKTYIRSFATP